MAALASLANLSEGDVAIAILSIQRGDRLLFQSKANRDLVWSKLDKATKQACGRGSVRNQLLDPRYTFEGRNLEDKGLGNDYRHYHAVLYEIHPTWRY